MRFLYILTAFVLFTFSLHAQNWSLVMPNDTLVYEKEGSWHYLSTVWVDSIHTTSIDTTYFMNRISPGKVIDTIPAASSCVSNYYNEPWVLVRELNMPQFCGASVKKSGTKWELSYKNRKVVIYPESQVGHSWLSDRISGDSMRVLSIELKTLEAYLVQDSVKTFRINGKTFSLSKNHGWVTELDLSVSGSYPTKYTIVGVQNQSLGDIIPMGKDFFNYNIGDVFKRTVGHANSDGFVGYSFKRTVIDKQLVGDTLTYTYSFNSTNYTTVIKYWPDMNPMLNAFPNTIAEVRPIFLDTMLYDSGLYAVVEVSNYSNGNSVKRNMGASNGYCLMDSVWIDYRIYGPFCEYRLGLEPRLENTNNGFETNHDVLTAYYVNGVLYGDTVLSVSKLENESYFDVFPNPTSSIINVTTEKINGISVLEMYDLQGRLIITKNFESELTLDVSEWSPGLYFAVVKDTDGTVLYREKIVVQKF